MLDDKDNLLVIPVTCLLLIVVIFLSVWVSWWILAGLIFLKYALGPAKEPTSHGFKDGVAEAVKRDVEAGIL